MAFRSYNQFMNSRYSHKARLKEKDALILLAMLAAVEMSGEDWKSGLRSDHLRHLEDQLQAYEAGEIRVYTEVLRSLTHCAAHCWGIRLEFDNPGQIHAHDVPRIKE